MFTKIIIGILTIGLSVMAMAQEDNPFNAPSQLGAIGLLYTPSAYMSDWATVDAGFTHFNKGSSLTYSGGEASERTFLANMVFLPRVEFSVRLTRTYSNLVFDPFFSGIYHGIGDRSLAMRVQVLKEKKNQPALVIGVQDPFGVLSFFSTNYMVLSKRFMFHKVAFSTTAGYGIAIGTPFRTYLQGAFGGLQAEWKGINGLIEYDTQRLNVGLGYRWKNCLFLKMALVDKSYFTGHISVRFQLKQ